MNFNGLDLNLLVALNVLLEQKNITRAAEHLHLSQSATSGALARLREYFADDLMLQIGRKMVLTPQAESLVKPVRDVLLQLQTITETKPTFDPAGSHRKFTLMMADHVAMVLMANAMEALLSIAPHLAFEIRSSEGILSDLILDRSEIDLLILPEKYVTSNHPSDFLFEDSFCCIVWSGNTLIDDHISLEQYSSLGHVVTQFANQLIPVFDGWLMEYGLVRKVEVTTMNFTTAARFVVGSNRIATVQTRMAKIYARHLPLKILPLPAEHAPSMIEKIQWHKSRQLDPANIWLREYLKTFAHQSGLYAAPKTSDGC